MTSKSLDLLIVGGGPAGLTAGIYAARSGLDATIIDEGMCGGLAATSPWIENYPGFVGISGTELTQKMKEHAEKNTRIETEAHIDGIKKSNDIFVVNFSKMNVDCKAIILATGSKHKKLDVPGEKEFAGKGVSYCATCDGTFFRGKRVAVVGGGNNGATEALYLRNLGIDVTLVHRRDNLRAEEYLQSQMNKTGVKLMLESVIEEICGQTKVTSLRIKSVKTGKTNELPFDGLFVSIGEEPSTELATQMGVKLREDGYVLTDRAQRTNVHRVYAAGDVTGGVRQIITACAQGAVAALSAYEDLKMPYWKK
jgi:thioredoxin reductase (NADPH)